MTHMIGSVSCGIMVDDKEKFYFKMSSDGLKHFECVFCGDKPVAGHSTEREYDPVRCIHPELKKLAGQGIVCSRCYNWDTDKFKRYDSPTNRLTLRHKSGRELGLKGWLDEQNNTIDSFLG